MTNHLTVPPTLTFTGKTHHAVYNGENESSTFPLYSVIKNEVPFGQLPKNTRKDVSSITTDLTSKFQINSYLFYISS